MSRGYGYIHTYVIPNWGGGEAEAFHPSADLLGQRKTVFVFRSIEILHNRNDGKLLEDIGYQK